MKKKCIFWGIGFIVAVCFVVIPLFYDANTIRITRNIYFDSQRKDILDRDGKYEIPPKVLDYCQRKNIILIKWKPDYPIPAIYEKYDYCCSDSTEVLYWVINLGTENQIGPMDYSEFLHYCESNMVKSPF